MKTKNTFLLLSLLSISTACVDLKAVNSYSGKSVEAIEKFSEIDFSFERLCNEDLETKRLNTMLMNSNYVPISLDETQNDCDDRKKADEAFNKMYFVTLEYLKGLEALSSDDVLAFEYDTLANALNESTLLHVQEAEIDAFKKLVDLTTRFAVDIKRRKDLQNIIEEANAPFQQLVGRLIYITENPLKLTLETERQLEYSTYKLLVAQSNMSMLEKLQVEADFIEKRAELLEKEKLLETYVEMLKEVQKGHQALYDNRDKIHKKEIITFLSNYITEIRELKTQFDNLKTED